MASRDAINGIRITVVIPTYNRAALVPRAIESVLGQTRAAEEVLAVNDGSTDGTEAVIEGYSGVRQVRKENGGLSSARNAGILAAKGEWIALLDDDDWFAPEMLAELERAQLRTGADVIYTASYRVDADTRVSGQNHKGHSLPADPLRSLVRENFILSSAVLVRKQILVDAGLFDPEVRLCEDQDLWLRVASLGARFHFVDQPLAYITKCAGSMSSSGVRMAEATLAVLKRRTSYLTCLGADEGPEWWLAQAHYRLGRAQWENGDPAAAVVSFREACRLDPQLRIARLYCLVLSKPALLPAFRQARGFKRAIVSLLQRWGALEARWG